MYKIAISKSLSFILDMLMQKIINSKYIDTSFLRLTIHYTYHRRITRPLNEPTPPRSPGRFSILLSFRRGYIEWIKKRGSPVLSGVHFSFISSQDWLRNLEAFVDKVYN